MIPYYSTKFHFIIINSFRIIGRGHSPSPPPSQAELPSKSPGGIGLRVQKPSNIQVQDSMFTWRHQHQTTASSRTRNVQCIFQGIYSILKNVSSQPYRNCVFVYSPYFFCLWPRMFVLHKCRMGSNSWKIYGRFDFKSGILYHLHAGQARC